MRSINKERSWASKEYVTPEMAAEWLAGKCSNRNIRLQRVAALARELRSGSWRVNGETIKFMASGELADGQHRLTACVNTGIGFWTWIIRDIEKETFATVDQGAKRTAADVLMISGEANASVLAGALRSLYFHIHGSGWAIPTAREIDDLLRANPTITESIAAAKKTAKLIPPSIGAFLHYEFSRRSRSQADDFFQQLADGARTGSAVWLLRERLQDNRASKAKLRLQDMKALVIKAWNFERVGMAPKLLKWTSSGKSAAPFPEIK